MLSPLLCGGAAQYTCRVSSTLNRDTKQFGKKYLFDGNNETCWNSDQVNNCTLLQSSLFLYWKYCRVVLNGFLLNSNFPFLCRHFPSNFKAVFVVKTARLRLKETRRFWISIPRTPTNCKPFISEKSLKQFGRFGSSSTPAQTSMGELRCIY